MLHTIFLICFGVGAGFVILSSLFGAIAGQFGGGGDASFDGAEMSGDLGMDLDTDFDIDLDVGGDIGLGGAAGESVSFDTGGLDGNADGGGFVGYILGHGVSPFKPMVIATFLTLFGGSGLLMQDRFWPFALAAAILIGLASAFLLFRLVYVPLHKLQSHGVVEKQRLVGLSATVAEAIPQGGFGKINYIADGNRYTAPAKAEDGEAIARGSAVQIMYIERNLFFVKIKF